LIFNRLRPAIRPARFARRGGVTAFASPGGTGSRAAAPHGVAALAATPRCPPGCPLKFASGAAVFAFPPLWSPPLGAPSAGAKNTFAPSAHIAPIPGAFLRAINRA